MIDKTRWIKSYEFSILSYICIVLKNPIIKSLKTNETIKTPPLSREVIRNYLFNQWCMFCDMYQELKVTKAHLVPVFLNNNKKNPVACFHMTMIHLGRSAYSV